MKIKIAVLLLGVFLTSSCNDFLDREPLEEITPEIYFNTSEQLGAYAIERYENILERGTDLAYYTLGVFAHDDNTDVQVTGNGNTTRWVPGVWTVPSADGGWAFNEIYNINYFFDHVLPKYKAGQITGNESDIDHYIGEMYMLRAIVYFSKLRTFGDFPILRHTLDLSDKEGMVNANERRPMNEVGRFIIQDLDSAATLMYNPASDDKSRNRITKDAALLFKSRVGLYLGSWLKNFKGTPFVPGGPGWKGAEKSYNSGFSIDIDQEINYFLDECMKASKDIADRIPLVENNQADYSTGSNPYVLMYTDKDLSKYSEVILWNATSISLQATSYGYMHAKGGGGTGYTRAFVNSFLSKDGLPIYASSLYAGDENLASVKKDRDNRLVQFMKIKGEALSVLSDGTISPLPAPVLLTTVDYKSTTGYDVKKGLTMSVNDKNAVSQESGIIEYRAAEAYLNYIEASYLRNGSINSDAATYWKAIRTRAGVDPDYTKTIQATDMNKEAGLLSAYTAGRLVDPTLYNIRRERSCELMSEGFRWDDLRRWRSMDQIINTKYIPEGFKLWGEMKNWYVNEDGSTRLFYLGDQTGSQPNVSSPTLSSYLRPYQIIKENNDLYNGYSWMAAYYLSPIGLSQFNITSGKGNGSLDYSTSPIYQNPGWTTVAGDVAHPVDGF